MRNSSRGSRLVRKRIAMLSNAITETSSNSTLLSSLPSSVPSSTRKESHRKTTSSRPTYPAIEISSDGAIKIVNLSLPEILRKSSLHVRDLFSLALTQSDGSGNQNHSSYYDSKHPNRRMFKMPLNAILPRENEVIMSFGYVRAIVRMDSVLIFDAQNPSVKHLATHLSQIFEQKTKESRNIWLFEPSQYVTYLGDPFELVFMEEVLRDTCNVYHRRIHIYEPIVDSLLSRVSNEVFSDQGVHRLMPIKDSLQEFEMNVKSSLNCLQELLDSNESLRALQLSDKTSTREKKTSMEYRSHQNVELLFEEYARQLNTVLEEINYLLKRVQSKQELIGISLSAYRNRMIRMNVYLSITGISIAFGTVITSFYGMNLMNGLETSPTAFSNVILSTSIVSVSVFAGCMSYISGSSMKKRAIHRHEEIEMMSGALSNMDAIDYAVRHMADQKQSLSKEAFKEKLTEFRQRPIQDRELDLLFGAIDVGKNGIINRS